MMMHATPMIVTGAERSVAQLRLIFERADSPVDVRTPIETVQVQEPVAVAAEPASEPEQEAEPALELMNDDENELKIDNETQTQTETETETEIVVETAISHESECEDAPVCSYEREMPSSVDDGAAAHNDEHDETQAPLDPTSTSTNETGSDSGSDVAVAPMPMPMPMPRPLPRPESMALKTRSLIRPPQVTRSAPRLASAAPSQANTSTTRPPTAASEARETPRGTTRHAKSNEQELARARQWRENKKALDSRVAAAKPRYMMYTTSSRYIAHREASVAQRQQAMRTIGTTRATTMTTTTTTTTTTTPTRRP